MASIGSFGAAVREFAPGAERDTFEFFGKTFTVEGVIPPMLMVQLGAAIAGKVSDMSGNAAIWEVFRCSLSADDDDEQFNLFYQLAVRKRCTLDELLKLALSILGVQAGKEDTETPGTSPPGSPSASTTSNSSVSDTPA